MYRIVEVDGKIRAYICKNNKADRYGDPKEFNSVSDCMKWIDKHTYKGMSFKYEVVEIEDGTL